MEVTLSAPKTVTGNHRCKYKQFNSTLAGLKHGSAARLLASAQPP